MMRFRRMPGRSVFLFTAFLMLFFAAAPAVCAGEARVMVAPESQSSERLELTTGKSLIVECNVPVKRVSLADPAISDIIILSDRQVYLSAKETGSTTLTLWDRSDEILAVFDLDVYPDVSTLRGMLYKVMPEEREISVMSVKGAVTLSGTVTSAANLDRALTLARAYSGGEVVNLMRVGGVHQIMVEVKVAEMARTVLNKLGVNLSLTADNNIFYTLLNGLTSPEVRQDGSTIINLSPNVNMVGSITSGDDILNGYIEALEQEGMVQVLAEPNLICISGQSADFLSGGEIPIPVPSGLGTTAIEYKQFGVSLRFTPTVLSDERISIEVAPEVSELDFANQISVEGFTIPAISSRRASTVIELGDGQTFVIAGLLRDNVRDVIDRFPGIGRIPILGALFSSKEYQKQQTELVIIVTPHLVKPMDAEKLVLPTDHYRPPTDVEFYLTGRRDWYKEDSELMEEALPPAVPAAGGRGKGREQGLEGRFGHELPD